MFSLPTDSPKNKVVPPCFNDEEIILSLIKREDTQALRGYFEYTDVDPAVVARLIGYSINMVKPKSFIVLCGTNYNLVPPDVMKRIFHTINCDKQDGQKSNAEMVDMSRNAYIFAKFLNDNALMDIDDVAEATEIYKEYDLKDLLGNLVANFFRN